MNDQSSIERLLEQSAPPAPGSAAPDVGQLQRRVSRRRVRRKIGKSSALTAIVAAALASLYWLPSDRLDRLATPEPTALAAGVTQDVDPLRTTSNHVEASPGTTDRIRVVGKVIRRQPLFELVQGTQDLQWVGWIDSQELVPVDLSQIPGEQQATIEAILDENSTERYFNL